MPEAHHQGGGRADACKEREAMPTFRREERLISRMDVTADLLFQNGANQWSKVS